MINKELEICPICGSQVLISYVNEDENHGYPKISCSHCRLSMRGNNYRRNVDSEEEAKHQSTEILINHWNNRTDSINVVQRIMI